MNRTAHSEVTPALRCRAAEAEAQRLVQRPTDGVAKQGESVAGKVVVPAR